MTEYRGYKITADSSYPSMKRVEAIGRGSVHLALRGLFTSIRIAQLSIDAHKEREGDNGKNG